MEDLLVEMKMDVARLPNELSKIPSVSKQLKMDELSTLTKMAQRGEVVPASVITQAPLNKSVISSTTTEKSKSQLSSLTQQPAQQKPLSKKETAIVQDSKSSKTVTDSTGDKSTAATNASSTQYTHTYTPASGGTLVPLTGNTGLRLQTPEGLIVAASSVPYTTLQTSKASATTNDRSASYTAVNVPAYVDSNQVYQAAAVQLVPVSASQQIMVWPSSAVVQQGKAPAQLTVVQGSQLLSMVDTSSGSTTQVQKTSSSNTASSNANIITID